jgi:hypothetical protein
VPTTVTRTVKSAGGDYTSLSAWEAAQQGDLVAADELRQAECYGMNDSTGCTIDGSTTDATRYLRVFAAAGAEAQLPYNTSGTAYRRDINGNGLTVSDPFTRIERIQLGIGGSSSGDVLSIEVTNVRVIGCVIRSTSSGNPRGIAVKSGVGSASVNIRNCFLIGNGGTSMGVNIGSSFGSTSYVYNCTSVGWGTNYNRSGSGVGLAINCLSSGGVVAGFGGTWSASSSHNASTDATCPGSSARNSQTFTFVSSGTGDYRLASTDAGARDFGTDLSADANYPFSDDFDAAARSGTWDIGADEYIAAGGTTFTQSLSGSGTPAGTVAKAISATKSGSSTPSGAVARQTAAPRSGSVTPAGSLGNAAAKGLAGTSTPTGVMTFIKVALLTLLGSITPSGTLAKLTTQSIAGAAAASGQLLKTVAQLLAGGLTPAGAIGKSIAKSLAGLVSAAGALTTALGEILEALLGTRCTFTPFDERTTFTPAAAATTFTPYDHRTTFTPYDGVETFTPDP